MTNFGNGNDHNNTDDGWAWEQEEDKHDAIMLRIADKIRLACKKLGIAYDVLNVGTCIGLEYVDHYSIEKNCWDALVAAYDAETASVIMSEISFA